MHKTKNNWLIKAGKLLNSNFPIPAAGIAEVYVCNNEPNSIEETLMGYALADKLLRDTLFKISQKKDTASNEDEENLKRAIKLARATIPAEHPLLLAFLKEASYYEPNLKSEVEELSKVLNESNA